MVYTALKLLRKRNKIQLVNDFYINANGNLVISFDKYEVAPGYMCIQEFVIPTEAVYDLLVSHNYVK